jgi:hypothetical protein
MQNSVQSSFWKIIGVMGDSGTGTSDRVPPDFMTASRLAIENETGASQFSYDLVSTETSQPSH